MVERKYQAILFDLGGVLVELSGISTMQSWTNWDLEELWRRWLASPTVRRFESGQIPAEQFGRDLVQEFSLPVEADYFLKQFTQWPKGPFPGVEDLFNRVPDGCQIGCLSNTNALHWEIMNEKMGFFRRFDACFPSHLTGYLKPDEAAFEYVVARLGLSPESILFIDDNQINVDGAKKVGLAAYTAHGAEGAMSLLTQLGL
jgi:FMN phosphatase YigB (HAD superfamily)